MSSNVLFPPNFVAVRGTFYLVLSPLIEIIFRPISDESICSICKPYLDPATPPLTGFFGQVQPLASFLSGGCRPKLRSMIWINWWLSWIFSFGFSFDTWGTPSVWHRFSDRELLWTYCNEEQPTDRSTYVHTLMIPPYIHILLLLSSCSSSSSVTGFDCCVICYGTRHL